MTEPTTRPGARSTMRAPERRSSRGAAAAEAAAVLPVSVAVLLLLVWLLSLPVTHVRVVDAAREAARAAARADSRESALEAARRVAPRGARVEVDVHGDEVVVRVTADVPGPGGLLPVLPTTVSATASTLREDR